MNVEGSNPFTRSSFPEKKTGLNRRSFLFLSYPPLKRPPLSRKHLRGKAISSKAPRLQTWITVEQAHRGHGPLGDRSLPRKSSGYIRVAEKSTSPKNLRGGAISSKAPRLQTWNTADTDRSEIGPYLRGLRATSGWPKNPPHPNTSEVGRFLRKRHVCRHGTPSSRPTADTDRSEIGPYLGSLWAASGGPKPNCP